MRGRGEIGFARAEVYDKDALRAQLFSGEHYGGSERVAGLLATVRDRESGIHFKSFVFAVTIGVVSCAQGLQTIGGPRGIGRSVTKAVVNSIVLILIFDYFLTRLLLYFEE